MLSLARFAALIFIKFSKTYSNQDSTQIASSLWMDEDKIRNTFLSGDGIPWADHHHNSFCDSEALFRPGYKAHLTSSWIKTLSGVETLLQDGAHQRSRC